MTSHHAGIKRALAVSLGARGGVMTLEVVWGGDCVQESAAKEKGSDRILYIRKSWTFNIQKTLLTTLFNRVGSQIF